MLYQYTCRFNFAIQVDFLSDKGMVFRQMSLMIFMTDEVVSVWVLPNIVFPLRYSIWPAAHHGTVQFTRRRREGGHGRQEALGIKKNCGTFLNIQTAN